MSHEGYEHVTEADAVSTAHHESATQAVAVLGCQRQAVVSGAMVGGGSRETNSG
jgi:hypothetical protein